MIGSATRSGRSLADLPGTAAFAVFCVSLFVYWLASYSLKGKVQDRLSSVAHTLLMLSLGLYFIRLGVDIELTDACVYPLHSSLDGVDLLTAVTQYFQERDWCPALGYAFLLIGGTFSWPALNSFARAVIRANTRQ